MTHRATKLLIATTNVGKAREFREMLAATGYFAGFEFTDLTAQSHSVPDIEECGDTFLANASLKASGYATFYNTWALADDSGLAIDALEGAPGIYSARWAERHQAGKGDVANNALVLRQMHDVADDRRTARFICALALSNERGQIVATSTGTVEGRLLRAPRGHNGFGYDPLFLIPHLNQTTAELTPEEKHALSHRGKALRQLKAFLSRPHSGHRP